MAERAAVRLEPWGEDDLPLLEMLNAPEMTEHLGGPEPAEKLAERQLRYQQLPADKGRVFKVIDEVTARPVGSVVYWDRSWRDEDVFEIGWALLPEFQGRGLASAAVAEGIAKAKSDRRHRFLHAFPSIANGPSNAICRKLGFTLLGECDFEYPKGNFMRCNDWRLDLDASGL